MDSAYLKTHKRRLIYHSKVIGQKVNILDGFGFMQITRVAQSCHLGNNAEFVVGPHQITKHPKKFIGTNFSRFRKCQIDYQACRVIKMYLSVQSYFYRPAISLTNQSIENVYFVIKLFFFFFYLLIIYRYHGPTHIIRPCL